MTSGNIRRAQLVTPFGVGAMSILVDGTSVITAGLDHWFSQAEVEWDESEFQVHDWRLEERLKVKEFRLPPSYRKGTDTDRRNAKASVPALRFPGYSFCMYCKCLKKVPPSFAEVVRCEQPGCTAKGKRGAKMSQVPFVAICNSGHMEDFPFREWVHRSLNPTCTGVLRLVSTGRGGLEGQTVRCGTETKDGRPVGDGCGKWRSLQGITTATRKNADGEPSTTLTQDLTEDAELFLCKGASPWLHQESSSCGQPMQGALRASGNVYFPIVESSIFLPQKIGAVNSTLAEILKRPDVEPGLEFLHEDLGTQVSGEKIRRVAHRARSILDAFSDDDVVAAYLSHFGVGRGGGQSSSADLSGDLDIWRYPEFQLLRETPSDDELRAEDPGIHRDMTPFFSRVRQVPVLRETRVLRGFMRGRGASLKLADGKALLRRNLLPPEKDWLPAYVVKGEGIYMELDLQRLEGWERREDVQRRVALLADRYGHVVQERGGDPGDVSPRRVLLHTLSHLLINQLIYTCGYSSASLRERLYVSRGEGREMAGLLIYTAAGDSEGTMGGLVRMARPDRLRPVLGNAVANARWCSTDPVCMDSGQHGQGPDSCNLAACHACALLPETSCEEFNRLLDRGLVIGTFENPGLGFFSELSEKV